MNDRWIHVAREGEKLGKFGLSDIPALVDARLLKPSDDYWEPGMPEWHPLSELPELRAVGARSEDWKGEAKDAIAGATGLLARGASALAEKARSISFQGWDRSYGATQRLLEDFLPQARELIRKHVAEKPFLASRTALENDDLMQRSFGAVFDTLPVAVRRFVSEDQFVSFCMEKRSELMGFESKPSEEPGGPFHLVCRHTHTRLLVDDFDLVCAYYEDVLGLHVRFKEDGMYAEFDTGPSLLALFHRDFMAEAIGASAPHERSHSLQRPVVVLGVEDIDAAYIQLKERGAAFASEPTDRYHWGVRTAHLTDPEGNLIELNSPLRQR